MQNDFAVSQIKTEREVENVRLQFLQRLIFPHSDLEGTFAKYSSFETRFDNTNYVARLKSANLIASKCRSQCEIRDSFEYKISQNHPNVELFYEYIEYEKSRGDVGRVPILFERALVLHCLNPQLWRDYINYYVISKLSSMEILSVGERATRNCMYDVATWCLYLELFAQNDMDADNVTAKKFSVVFERALGFVSATQNVLSISQILSCRASIFSRSISESGIDYC